MNIETGEIIYEGDANFAELKSRGSLMSIADARDESMRSLINELESSRIVKKKISKRKEKVLAKERNKKWFCS